MSRAEQLSEGRLRQVRLYSLSLFRQVAEGTLDSREAAGMLMLFLSPDFITAFILEEADMLGDLLGLRDYAHNRARLLDRLDGLLPRSSSESADDDDTGGEKKLHLVR